MLTDRPPGNTSLLRSFLESDQLTSLAVPQDDVLPALARSVDSTMKDGRSALVRQACTGLLTAAAELYKVQRPAVQLVVSLLPSTDPNPVTRSYPAPAE